MDSRQGDRQIGLIAIAVALAALMTPVPARANGAAPDDSMHGRTFVFASFARCLSAGAIHDPGARFTLLPEFAHDHGFADHLGAGFFVSEHLAIGLSAGYARFPIDFGPEIEAQYPTDKANTSVLLGEAWARAFLPGGFNRWRPYALIGLGVGRPKGTIDYKNAFIIPLPDNGGKIELKSAESTVNTTVAITGGIGFLVPASPLLAIAIEPRYTSISTKGSGRTDKYTDTSGEVVKLEDKAKSNTNWWEIRGGIVFTIR